MSASISNSNEFIDLIPALRQNVIFREEPHGAILLNNTKDNYGKYLLISPFEAFIISFFDGTRTIRDISNLLTNLRNSPDEQTIQKDINSFIQQRNGFIELIKFPLKTGRIQIDPLKFLSKPNIFSRPTRSFKPLWVDLYITRECNLKCIYCFANAKFIGNKNRRERSEVHRDRLYDLIYQIADLEIKRILLTGGEPTLIPYLPEIINLLITRNIEVILATNTYSMSDKLAQKLGESGLQEVQAKLDAATPKIQDKLSGIGGSLINLIKGIKILKQHSFKVSVASVATSLNIREIPQVIRICADLGVDAVSPRIYTPGIWALNGRGGSYLNPTPDSILWLEHKIADLKEVYKNSMEISSFESSMLNKKREKEVPRCPGFISSCAILENGLVVPCETLADFSNDFIIGNVNGKAIWYQ